MIMIPFCSGRTRRTGKYLHFTLVEMLVVIAIIGILASLLMPALTKAMDTARTATCANNQRQIGITSVCYANDNSNTVPSQCTWANSSGITAAWVVHLSVYTPKAFTAQNNVWGDVGSIKSTIFQCPIPYPSNTWVGNSYQINPRVVTLKKSTGTYYTLFASLPRIKAPSKTVLLCDGDGNGSQAGLDLYYHTHSRHGGYTTSNTLCVDGSVRTMPEVIIDKVLTRYSYTVTQ